MDSSSRRISTPISDEISNLFHPPRKEIDLLNHHTDDTFIEFMYERMIENIKVFDKKVLLYVDELNLNLLNLNDDKTREAYLLSEIRKNLWVLKLKRDNQIPIKNFNEIVKDFFYKFYSQFDNDKGLIESREFLSMKPLDRVFILNYFKANSLFGIIETRCVDFKIDFQSLLVKCGMADPKTEIEEYYFPEDAPIIDKLLLIHCLVEANLFPKYDFGNEGMGAELLTDYAQFIGYLINENSNSVRRTLNKDLYREIIAGRGTEKAIKIRRKKLIDIKEKLNKLNDTKVNEVIDELIKKHSI